MLELGYSILGFVIGIVGLNILKYIEQVKQDKINKANYRDTDDGTNGSLRFWEELWNHVNCINLETKKQI